MFPTEHKGANKFGYHPIEKVPLYLVTIFDYVHQTHLLQLNIAANGSEHVILYGWDSTYLEMLNVTQLLDSPMILFDLPM